MPEIEEIRRRREAAQAMGGPQKVARQRASGRLTVRERIDRLADPGSFAEIGPLTGFADYDEDGRLRSVLPVNFVAGTARIDGRPVLIGADDFTGRGGSGDAAIHAKQVFSEEYANQMLLPMVRLLDGASGGGAGIVNRHRAGRSWAWPSGDWGSLPVQGGIEAAFRAQLDQAADRDAEIERIRRTLAAFSSPFRTAERFGVQDLIDPRDSRPLLCAWVRDAYRVLPGLTGRPSFGTRPSELRLWPAASFPLRRTISSRKTQGIARDHETGSRAMAARRGPARFGGLTWPSCTVVQSTHSAASRSARAIGSTAAAVSRESWRATRVVPRRTGSTRPTSRPPASSGMAK